MFHVREGKIVEGEPPCQEQSTLWKDVRKPYSPTRASTLPDDAKERKKYPVSTGFLNYFPDAVIAVSHVSYLAGEQHHPGEPTHWDRSKSSDEDDALMRHFLYRGTLDTDGIPHSYKMAWRAMALLQKEIEEKRGRY